MKNVVSIKGMMTLCRGLLLPLLLLSLLAACSGNEEEGGGDNKTSAADSSAANHNASAKNGSKAEQDLPLVQETTHVKFYSSDSGKEAKQVIAMLGEALEAEYKRITELFHFEVEGKTVVHVFTDKEAFSQTAGGDKEGAYLPDENIIKVYAPAEFSGADSRDKYVGQLLHEFVHAVIQQVNPTVVYVKWLDEGSAYYVSNQLSKTLETKPAFTDVPDMEQLTSEEYFESEEEKALLYSGTIIQFIVEQYGTDVWNEILRQPDALEEILEEPLEAVYEKWTAYLDNLSG